MNFNIIGTGNTAWFMAKRLKAAGHTCVGIYGRNPASANALADAINCPVYNSIADIHDEADCCIIAISDHAIESIVVQLSFQNTVLVHTAGSVMADVLSVATADYGVLWPIYSILKDDLPQHRNIPTVWEGSTPKAKQVIEELGNCISDMVFYADSEQRRWLHLSAVIGNNFTNHLLTICEEICTEKQMPFPLLFPIIIQTLERVTANSPMLLQTGPARRGDTVVLQKHMEMLESHADWQLIYDAISNSIKNMYK
jgi:predicted short-subunit dehydrogenase-like oxidoreductase (DUF2520 family)